MKNYDKTFLILLIIQVLIIFGMGFIGIGSETVRTILLSGIILTMGVWYVLSIKNKTTGK